VFGVAAAAVVAAAVVAAAAVEPDAGIRRKGSSVSAIGRNLV